MQIFLWHRFIRLYPVHITVLAGLVAIVSLAHAAGFIFNNPQEWQWNELLWQLTLLHAWGVTASPGWNAPSWSISAEWFAYLLFPLLAPALVRIRGRGIALLVPTIKPGQSLDFQRRRPTFLAVYSKQRHVEPS